MSSGQQRRVVESAECFAPGFDRHAVVASADPAQIVPVGVHAWDGTVITVGGVEGQ